MTESAAETARAYYEAIDAQRYDRFADLLAPGVVHERPDRTFEGRETLVEFMRDGRPNTDTSHEIDAVYTEQSASHGQAASPGQAAPRGDLAGEVAARGRLLDADGEQLFAFVDVFDVVDGGEARGENRRIERIRTYTR